MGKGVWVLGVGEWWARRDACGERVVPACAGMTEGGAGMTEKGAARVIGAQRDLVRLARGFPPPT